MRSSRILTWLLALTLGTAGALVFGAGPAQAASVVVNGPGNVKVTVSNDHVHPGDRIQLSGEGFVPDLGSGSGGNPVLAIKINGDNPGWPEGWTAGGADYVANPEGDPGTPEFAAFKINDNGTFTGWLEVSGSQANWDTYLQFLGGSLTTVPGGVRLPAMAFRTDLRVLGENDAAAWITSNSHIPGGSVAVQLRNYERQDGQGGQKVAFKIDGTGDVLACIQTDAEGDGSGVVPIPSDLTGKDHQLNVLAGSACGEGPQAPGRVGALDFTLTEAAITSSTHAPGGKLTVKLSNFKNATGVGGQAVAFKIDGAGDVLACIQTDGDGNKTGDVPIPASIATGSHVLNVLAGTACGVGPQPPGRSIALPFDVTEAATPTVARATGGSVKGTKLTLTLKPGTAATTKLVVKSKAKVKLKGSKKKVITVAEGSAKGQDKVSLTLSGAGKKYFRTHKALKVAVTSKAAGAKTVTKTFKVKKK